MLNIARLLIALGLLLGGFCWWGMFSAGGQRRFDEMDGMIPFFAGVAGAFAFLAGLVLLAWRHWSSRRNDAVLRRRTNNT